MMRQAISLLLLAFGVAPGYCQQADIASQVLAAPVPTAPTGPTAPTAPVASPEGVASCPASFQQVTCAKPLQCNYNPVKCCGRTLYSRSCRCDAGGTLTCRVQRPNCRRPCKPKSVRKCPKTSPRNVQCTRSLRCRYGKVSCCGRSVYTENCTCKAGGKFTCASAGLQCSSCPKKPKPKPTKKIVQCPKRAPSRNNSPICVKQLRCAYGRVCCGKELPPQYIRCSCEEGQPLRCRQLRIAVPPCPETCDDDNKEPTPSRPCREGACEPPQKRSWPNLVGETCEDTKKVILSDFPGASPVLCILEGTPLTEDFSPSRVRIIVDENQIVVEAPRTG